MPRVEAPAMRSARGRRRVAWLLVTVGCLGWTVCEFLCDQDEYAARLFPFPSLGGVALLLWPLGVCAGLLLYPSSRSEQSRIRQHIDGFAVATLLFLVAWSAFWGSSFSRAVAAGGGPGLALACLAGDVAILTTAAIVVVRAGAATRLPLALLVLGVVCMTTSGGGFAYLVGQYGLTNPIGLGWIFGLLFIAVSAGTDFSDSAARDWAPARVLPSWVSMVLPYVPVLFTCGVAAFVSNDGGAEIPARVAGLALIAAVLVRKFVVARDGIRPMILNSTQVPEDPSMVLQGTSSEPSKHR